LAMRRLLGLRPAPEFEAWLQRMGVFVAEAPQLAGGVPAPFAQLLERA